MFEDERSIADYFVRVIQVGQTDVIQHVSLASPLMDPIVVVYAIIS